MPGPTHLGGAGREDPRDLQKHGIFLKSPPTKIPTSNLSSHVQRASLIARLCSTYLKAAGFLL
jgi:hypothetical protein